MDTEFWILAIVPILALVAIADSIVGFSASLARRIGCRDAIWAHIALLFLVLPDTSFGCSLCSI